MVMPCLPAYGGYHHHWLKAVRKQQTAYATLHLDASDVHDVTELPDSSAEALQLVTAITGATTSSDSKSGPFIAQALSVARQNGFASPESMSTLGGSMPRSKPEKQANKQAMATISKQLNPAHIQLQTRTPDKQHPPTQSSSSHEHPTGASRTLQATSFSAVAKQQLLSFCSTAPCSTSTPAANHHAAAAQPTAATDPPPGYFSKEWDSQLSISLEEPIILDAAKAAADPWPTAEEQAAQHPDAHSTLAFKGCTMQCPDGGFGKLWLKLPDDAPAPGVCDALYTKVDAIPWSAQPHQLHLVKHRSLDSLIESMFKVPRHKHTQLHQEQQTASANQLAGLGPAAAAAAADPPGGTAAICWQIQAAAAAAAASAHCTVGLNTAAAAAADEAAREEAVAARVGADPVAAAAADELDDAAATVIHQTTASSNPASVPVSSAQQKEPRENPSSAGPQEVADFLLEEPMLRPLQYKCLEQSLLKQQQQQNEHQLVQGTTAQQAYRVQSSGTGAAEQQLVTVQQLVHFAKVQQVDDDDENICSSTGGPAAAAAASQGVSTLAAAAEDCTFSVCMPWENYTAVDFRGSNAVAKPAAAHSSHRPAGNAVQQHPLQLPTRVAACVLPTADLLLQSCSSNGSPAAHKQQGKQHPLGPTAQAGSGSVDVSRVLQSAVVATAGAGSPRRRRVSSRFAETPICAAAAAPAAAAPMTLPAAAAAETPTVTIAERGLQQGGTHALHDDAPMQQQQVAREGAPAVAAHPSQHNTTPAAAMATKTPLTVAVSAAMTSDAAAGLPDATARSVAAAAEDEDFEDPSEVLQLSPSDMIIEAPVCFHEYKGPLLQDQLLQEVLRVARQLVMQPAAAAAGQSQSQHQQNSKGWDASWGNLEAGFSAAAAGDARASNNPWWTSQAVHNLLSGQCPAISQDGQLAGEQSSNLESASKAAGDCPAAAVNPRNLGSVLLEQMLAADMQVDSGGLLLPVPLFPEDIRMGVAAAGDSSGSSQPDFIMQLISGCGCKRHSTAHLELYFDWSWLQPLPAGAAAAAAEGTAITAVGSKRHRYAAAEGTAAEAAAAWKRYRPDGDAANNYSPSAAAVTSAATAPVPFDVTAWINVVQRQPTIQIVQLFRELKEQLGVQPAAAAAGVKWQRQDRLWCLHALQDCMQLSQQQQQQQQVLPAGSHHTEWGVDTAGSVEEQTPPAVAAAVAAWDAAQAAKQSAMIAATAAAARQAVTAAPAQPGLAAAAAGGDVIPAGDIKAATPTAAAAAPSDMDFFMQLQSLAAAAKGGSRANKRRHSIAQQQQQQQPADLSAANKNGEHAGGPVTSAAGVVSGGVKRPRVWDPAARLHSNAQAVVAPSIGQDGLDEVRGEKSAVVSDDQQQQQQHYVAEMALNGIPRGQPSSGGAAAAAAGHSADQQQQQLVVLQPPIEIEVSLPLPLLQIMLSLQGNRKAVLASIQDPDHSLLSCKLWDDLAVQHVITQFQKSAATLQDQPAAAMQQQKQHARKLGALLILAQTAGCLLHYGIRVAHLFLQHSLQKLPSVAAACAEAAAALVAAYKAVEKLPATAAVASSSSSSSRGTALAVQEDHPKLGRLRELLMQVKSAKPGCKLLLVAETKAFFSLYQSISAAGFTAVQLDRTKKLLQTPPAAASSNNAAAADGNQAAAAAAAGWEAAVTAALASGQCVLITHEHLMHSSMPVDMFGYLVEYVSLDGVAGAAAVARNDSSSSSRRDAIVEKFSGCHYVIKVATPDLRQAAADTAAAAVAAAVAEQQQSSSVDPPILRPSTAAAAAVRPSTAQPAGPAVIRPTSATDSHTAAAAVVAEPQQAPAGPQYPLVLNRSPGSLLRQRKALYESLLQLEDQGYLLVERSLGSAAAAAAAGGGGSSGLAAAVDIVLSPVACLTIWGEARLPQDPASTMAQLSQTLLQLSMSYEAVYFIFELPDGLLQLVVKQLPRLQQAAAAVGVRLQVMISFSAANTQDYIHAICKSAASNFWSSSSSTTTSSSGIVLKPPSMSDVPTPQEAFLNRCCALNPLSAAVLTSKGVPLQDMLKILAAGQSDQADDQVKQLLTQLSVGIPAHSMRLLAAQVTALHLKLESDSPQLPKSSNKRKRGIGDQLPPQLAQEQVQQQQQHQMQEEYAHQLQPEQNRDTYQQQLVPDIMHGQDAPGQHYQPHPYATAAAAFDGRSHAQTDWQQQQQQRHRTAHGKQQQMHSHHIHHIEQPYAVHDELYEHPMQYDMMPEYQPDPVDGEEPYALQEQMQPEQQPMHQYMHHGQQQMRQQPPAGMDIDPAGVLDAFLDARKQQRTAALAGSRAGRAQQQQQRYAAQRAGQRGIGRHSNVAYMLPQQQQQQQQVPPSVDDDLPDITLPFAEMPGDAGPYQQQQQQQEWFEDLYGEQPQQQGWDPQLERPSMCRQTQRGPMCDYMTGFGQPQATAQDEAEFYDQQMAPAAFPDTNMYDEPDMAFDGVQHPVVSSNGLGNTRRTASNMSGRTAPAAGASQDMFGIKNRPPTAPSASRLRREVPGIFMTGDSSMSAAVQSGHKAARNPIFGGRGVSDSSARQRGAAPAAAGMFASAAAGFDGHMDGLGGSEFGDQAGPDIAWDNELEPGLGTDSAEMQDLLFRGPRGIPEGLARGSRVGLNGQGGVGTAGLAKPSTSASTSRSCLRAEAFMPHRNPSKQLKYKKGFGLVKGKGKQQSKLCWG